MARLDEISHALGRQEGLLEQLDRKMDDAAAERGAIRQNVIDVQADVTDVKAELAALAARVTTVEAKATKSAAVTDWVDQSRERGKGALFVAGIAGSAFTALAGTAIAHWWDKITAFFTGP